MNFKIQNHPALIVAGYKTRIDLKSDKPWEVIPGLWQSTTPEQYEALAKVNNRPPKGTIGAEEMVGEDALNYYVGTATEGPLPAGLEALDIPPGTWAVIEAVGPLPGSIQGLWAELREKGFTYEEYVWAMEKPDLEVYPPGDNQAEDYKCHLWLPLKPHWAEND